MVVSSFIFSSSIHYFKFYILYYFLYFLFRKLLKTKREKELINYLGDEIQNHITIIKEKSSSTTSLTYDSLSFKYFFYK